MYDTNNTEMFPEFISDNKTLRHILAIGKHNIKVPTIKKSSTLLARGLASLLTL